MTEQQRDPKFYVVGGAIQPGRNCYLQRIADAELYSRTIDGEYCHVLAQPQAGKTSLAASTAARLRAQDIGVAVVDLTRISAEDLSENAGRWYYSIVYRIARDLRLKADLQSWWGERGGLTNLQRLREFFHEIVLQESDQPVVIFIDRLEATRGEPLAQDLFAAIRACYDARATATEFNRLTFVMLAAASADELVGKLQGSPFEISMAVNLEDFSPQELSGLLNGLGELQADPEAIIGRVWNWTRGHPYLSQKVFRGLARRSDAEISIAAVDELVRRQFTAQMTLHEEPHISAVAGRMLREGAGRSARLNLYGRVRKGVEVAFDPVSETQHELLMTGIVSVGPAGELRVRNEIYGMVFSTRWVNQSLPFGTRGIAAGVAVLAILVALPVWYTEYLPRPYIRALNTVNQDYQVAEDAYSNLHALPGFGTTAERLFGDFLIRSSRSATTLTEVLRINSRLELLADGAQKGADLLAEYWERQAQSHMHAGDRDAALIAALEAVQVPTERRRRLTAELIGSDYPNLRASLHVRAPISDVRVDPQNNLITVLDKQNNVDIWRLGPEPPEHLRALRLIAEERLQLEQRRAFERFPAAPRLLIELSHEQPEHVQVVLRSPGGQEATLTLDQAVVVGTDYFAFDFNQHPQLMQLQRGELTGNWTLTLTDLERGAVGEFSGWTIGERSVRALAGTERAPQPIPAPRTSVNAMSRLSDDGRLAMTWPANPDTEGPLLIWDLVDDAVVARIPRGPGMRTAQFAMQGRRAVTAGAQVAEVWDAVSGRKLGQFAPAAPGQPRFQLSPNGRYASLIAQQREQPSVAVWDLDELRRTRVVPVADVSITAVDSAGRYLATGGRDNWVRVWSLVDGSLLHEFAHSAPVRSLQFDPQGDWLASDDLSNTFRLWNISVGGKAVIERPGSSEWSSAFAADSSRLIVGSLDRSYQVFELPAGRKTATRLRHTASGERRKKPGALLLAGLNMAVTTVGDSTIKLWQLSGSLAAKVPARTLTGDMRTALSPDGYLIAAGSNSSDLRIHVAGAPGGMLLQQPEGDVNRARLSSMEFSPDQRLLAAGDMEGGIRVWESGRGRLLISGLSHADGAVHDLLIDPDGNWLFSASRREIQVTDLETGKTLARLGVQANNPQLAYASVSGELFVAGDESGVTRWRWRNGISEMVVPGDFDITRVAASASGRRLVTASSQGQLAAWDIDTRRPLEQTLQTAARVDDLWLAEEGNRLTVQAGHWMHTVALLPGGLASRFTRLLSDTPAAAQPDDGGRIVSLLLPTSSRPQLMRVALAEPPVGLFVDDPAVAREAWQRRLSMMPDAGGQPAALLP